MPDSCSRLISTYGERRGEGRIMGDAFELVYSGKVLRNGRFENIDIGVSSGVIGHLGKNISGERRVKLDGLIIPAGTDTHVHFRDPWETEKEDFKTGSLSAIYGGTTTVFDMPNNRYPIDNYERYEQKLSAISGRSFCDFGLYSLFTGSNSVIIHEESSAIKIFLASSTNSLTVDQISKEETEALNEFQIPKVFHAELQSCINDQAIRSTDLKTHDLSRPEECERMGVQRAISFSLKNSVITHITCENSLSEARAKAVTEVAPHHLLLNNGMDLGSLGKVNPPLRSRATQERLLSLFLSGSIDNVSSDHAPHQESEKGEFEYASSGIIGVETRIPLLLSLVDRGILSIDLMVKTACQNPSSLMGMRKGRIEKGYLADFISFVPSDRKRIRDRYLHSKNTATPFEGFEAIFPRNVVMRGELVLENGEALDDPVGMYVRGLNHEKEQ